MSSYAGIARRLLLLLVTAIACASNSSASVVATAADPTGSNGWRADLNWTELESKLSPSAALIDTSFTDFRDQCIPEFYEERPTNHALIDQPSGMCLPHLLLGWEAGVWMNQLGFGPFMQMKPLDTVMGFEGDDTAPIPVVGDEFTRSLNLPHKVVFPAHASDVLLIILFAKKHKIEISVKNSGHSYSGASSKKNTLLMNMNRFTHYAPGGITDCVAALLGTSVADDLSNQACLLALARGKPGVIRVGGGENYDKVYRAVLAENQALDEYKYHLVGGAVGTVSPMGWTFQGGNAGTMGDRMYGKGVDQVLQVEMVLPNGYHVKFGPTEWEDASAEGFVVPRTKVVSGVCRSNPDEQDEEKWIWGDCPEDFDIDFGDLWFAVNGGGGGTWGVVTSMTLQLQDFLPYNLFLLHFLEDFHFLEECSAISSTFDRFSATYLMTPSLLNVTRERSLACSTPDGPELHCYGEQDVMQAWTIFLELNNSTDDAACLRHVIDSSSDESPKSYPEIILMGDNTRFPGKAQDIPGPMPLGGIFGNFFIPQSWIDESEENIDILVEY
jgi:FAD/FMN-containing dehydrogenase